MSGSLDSILPAARKLASSIEKVAVVSSALGLKRQSTHRLAALSRHRRYGFDLAISPGFVYLRSSQRTESRPRGIGVNGAFVRRFSRCGFPELLAAMSTGGKIGGRIESAVNWLFESRLETSLEAAVVKTAIALESLLIASENENLRGPLAERAAFLLSDDYKRRFRIAKAVRAFYDLRSGIVHGARRRRATHSPDLLEAADRLLVLILLTLGCNAHRWARFADLAAEVEARKWGGGKDALSRPYPGSHLSRALNLCERKSG